MPDLAQLWGADIEIGPGGDLSLTDGALLGQQRVLRRLLTNPGDYIWQPDYGAGLARFVGRPGRVNAVRAVIRSQIFKEGAVRRTPEPLIDVQFDNAGSVYVHIRYVDADSGQTQILTFSVNG